MFLVNPLLPKDVANKGYKIAVFWSPTSQSYPKFETYVSFRITWIIIPPFSLRWWRLSILQESFWRGKQSKSLIFCISSLVVQYGRRRFHENAEGSSKHEKKRKNQGTGFLTRFSRTKQRSLNDNLGYKHFWFPASSSSTFHQGYPL